MVADLNIAAPQDAYFQSWPDLSSMTDGFNDVAVNTNEIPSLGANFQMAAALEVAAPEAIQEYEQQEVVYNQELLTGVENAGMLPEIQPDMSANDSLFGAFCTITEEFSQDIAELSQAVGMGKQVSLGPVQVDPQQTMENKWTPPSPSMGGMTA